MQGVEECWGVGGVGQEGEQVLEVADGHFDFFEGWVLAEGGSVEGFGYFGVLGDEVVEGDVEFVVPGGGDTGCFCRIWGVGFGIFDNTRCLSWVEADGLGEVGLGGGGVLEGEVGEGADVVEPVGFGVEFEGAGDGGEGGLGVVGEEEEFGLAGDRPFIFRIELNGTTKVRDGIFVAFHRLVSFAAFFNRPLIFRIQLNRTAKVSDGIFVAFHQLVSLAA